MFANAPVFAAIETESKKVASSVSYTHVLSWSIGLIFVLALFFVCVWLMKKMGTMPGNTQDNMKIIGGLSLGMREKLVLVQIGNKQMVLAVTPGRINKLLVLEDEDKIVQQSKTEGDFSFKLKQIMSGSSNE